MSKALRQKTLINIITNSNISTQQELQDKLRDNGFKTTQATISRDIKELSIVKTISSDGVYKYDIPTSIKDKGKSPKELLKNIFSEAVMSVNFAQNIVVIKCHTGMAQAVCAKLDSNDFESVVGTLAGDDTIFVVLKSETLAIEFVGMLNNFLI